jgi:hypothetical protein
MPAPCGSMCIGVQNIRGYYWPEPFKLLSSPVGLQGEASPGAGERKRDRMCVTGADRPWRWCHGSQGRPLVAPASGGSRRSIFWRTCHRLTWPVLPLARLCALHWAAYGVAISQEPETRANTAEPVQVRVGYSIGGRGFRVGKDAKGRSYTAARRNSGTPANSRCAAASKLGRPVRCLHQRLGFQFISLGVIGGEPLCPWA